MDLIQALCRGPQQWRGLGRNHEDEEFAGRLELQPLVEERGVLLRYRALRLPDGRLVHEEATLLARDGDGALCLWPVAGEQSGVWCHRIVLPAGRQDAAPDTRGRWEVCFATGPRDEVERFRQEIRLVLDPSGELHCVQAWGLPGGVFEERSVCAMRAMPASP